MTRYVLSFAGAGRVASALCQRFYEKDIKIDRIVSGKGKSADTLAGKCKATAGRELKFDQETDVIIVAVPDHLLQEVLNNIECPEETLVAHTAGSFGLEVFPERIKRSGVFYPLQTFTTGRNIAFDNIPLFIEASDPDAKHILDNLAGILGARVHFMDLDKRKLIHLAAVFTCNFTNHMFTIGKTMALKAGSDFNVLEPLIRETVEKALEYGPESSQTGPAIRNDQITLKRHLDLLSFSPEFQDIYRHITQSIIGFHKKSEK